MIRDAMIEHCIYLVCKADNLGYPDRNGVLDEYRAYLEGLDDDQLIEEVLWKGN